MYISRQCMIISIINDRTLKGPYIVKKTILLKNICTKDLYGWMAIDLQEFDLEVSPGRR
jgi:hypothetical protein